MANWTEQVFKWLGFGRYRASPTAVGDGQVVELLVDPYGRLRTADEGPTPLGYSRTLEDTGALVKNTPGELIELWGFSRDTGQDLYLLLVNKASAAADEDTPLEVFPIPAGQPFAFSPKAPLAFSVGIAWAVSTLPDEVLFPMSDGAFCVTVAYR
jgi:hypothetical protein